ncbi:hypothetical protein AB0K09_17245, partial [Streptomyces sp. NPDC049577]|uniref:hypothetical protein n=1 Tax=Streptomyces sp. NPDC049577 TaxID=3155153 RepID=UPI003416EF14
MRGWLRSGCLTAAGAAAVFAFAGEAHADDLGAHATAGRAPVTAHVTRLPHLLPDHPPSHVRASAARGAVRANVVDNGKGCLDVTAHVLSVGGHVWLTCPGTAPAAPAAPAPAPAPAAPAPPAAGAPGGAGAGGAGGGAGG